MFREFLAQRPTRIQTTADQTGDYTGRAARFRHHYLFTVYNFVMRIRVALLVGWLLLVSVSAQEKPATEPKSVAVPMTIDHNRVVIHAEAPLADGSMERIHAWVDNGNAQLEMSRHLATMLGLAVTCGDKECSAPPPPEFLVGGMKISFAGIKEVKIPLKPVSGAAVVFPGMNAEINLPSTVLRQYDVLVDFPGKTFRIGTPGSIHFQGSSSKVEVNAENGLIQIPSQIENKKYNLALDVGASISMLSGEVFDKLATSHSDWPRMTGAVASANMWGFDSETKWKVMRVERVQYGPLFLTNVPFVEFPKEWMDFFSKRAGIATAGLMGADALQNYRIGFDYAHSTVYFDIGRLFTFPEFDVIGLVLRPEDDGGYTVLGAAEFEGNPSVDGVQPGDHLMAVDGIPVRGSTLGQVWAMLGGTPGQERKLTLERAGKKFVVAAKVQHFLAEKEQSGDSKKKH